MACVHMCVRCAQSTSSSQFGIRIKAIFLISLLKIPVYINFLCSGCRFFLPVLKSGLIWGEPPMEACLLLSDVRKELITLLINQNDKSSNHFLK